MTGRLTEGNLLKWHFARGTSFVTVVFFCCVVRAQYVVPLPPAGCLLPPDMVLTEFFDSTSPVSGVVYHQPVGSIVNAYLGPDNKEWMRTALVAACATEESDRSIAIHLERVTLAESITPDGPVRSGAFVDLDMLEWTNNEWRIRFSVKGEAIRKADPLDEGRHTRLLLEALQAGLEQYTKARADHQLTNKPFTNGAPDIGLTFPIEKMHGLPPGVFWTVDDFRNGRLIPISDSQLSIDPNGDFKLNGGLRRDQEKIYAVSDGKHYHLRWKDQFRRMVWNGSHFISPISRVEVSTGATIAFGMMGAALSAHRVNSILQLDLMDGRIHDVGDQPVNETAKHVFVFDPWASGNDQLYVRVWDDEIPLEPNSYCELFYPAFGGIELVNVRGPAGTLELTIDTNAKDGLHLLQLDVDGRPIEVELSVEEQSRLAQKLLPAMLRTVSKP